MCGIVGGISHRNVVPIILEGLSKLEYRGYDSVGLAIIDANGNLARERITGRVRSLTQLCLANSFSGKIGIGHTRWATHGEVTQNNAHPHFSNDTIAVVHNGIIENYSSLHDELVYAGYNFESETDTEVIVHLIHSFYIKTANLLTAVKQAISRLIGAYAIAVVCSDNPQQLVCARYGSPLILGVGVNEMFFASDISAILAVTQKIVYLEDGDVASINSTDYTVWDSNNQEVTRVVSISELSQNHAELGQYNHYMQKEIFEQPKALAETLQSLGTSFDASKFGAEAEEVFAHIDQVKIIACGTSLNAGYVAKYWIEEFAHLDCSIDIASEYRYKKSPPNPRALIINISQSGETADTLASVKFTHELGMPNSLSICNVPESSLVRLSKLHILTQAGPEIGVASTKAFTTQLLVLLYLTYTLAKVRGHLSPKSEAEIMAEIRKLPTLIFDVLKLEDQLKVIASELKDKQNALFLGRHTLYPIAIEGALKLKEISYIHAEGYAAGELKHGPLALIDSNMPSIVLMPSQLLLEKTRSNVQEILARQGEVYLFTDFKPDAKLKCKRIVEMPTQTVPHYLLPIIYTVPLQLLAYHTAIMRGTDVDKPRNLAKSVTVE
ncbi:MAG: hypothetical protein QG673_1128 [Pseudomonadota bacterium]|nr:hypothetical protein [Pseudomonadota bacterium]